MHTRVYHFSIIDKFKEINFGNLFHLEKVLKISARMF